MESLMSLQQRRVILERRLSRLPKPAKPTDLQRIIDELAEVQRLIRSWGVPPSKLYRIV